MSYVPCGGWVMRRVEIPKPAGRMRALGIPTARDRVAPQAAKQMLEPLQDLIRALRRARRPMDDCPRYIDCRPS